MEADGIGDQYCHACKGSRHSDDPCSQCPKVSLWHDNEPLARLLSACSTQWRVSPMGQLIGLDYPGVLIVADVYEIDLTGSEFILLQHLEREYLMALKDHGDRNT